MLGRTEKARGRSRQWIGNAHHGIWGRQKRQGTRCTRHACNMLLQEAGTSIEELKTAADTCTQTDMKCLSLWKSMPEIHSVGQGDWPGYVVMQAAALKGVILPDAAKRSKQGS